MDKVQFIHLPADASGTPVSASMPIAGLYHLIESQKSTSLSAAEPVLRAWLQQKLNIQDQHIIGVFELESKQMLPLEALFAAPDLWSSKELYVLTNQHATAATEHISDANQSTDDEQLQDGEEEEKQSPSQRPAASPTGSLFSLRLPNGSHRQVYFSELSDLIDLRSYTRGITLELLWGALQQLLNSAGASGISREALVALLHTLMQHARGGSDKKKSEIPTSVTASILRLYEMCAYDATHFQQESSAGTATRIDPQQLIASLIFMLEGATWDQLYLAFSLFTDDVDSDSDAASKDGKPSAAISQEDSLTKTQFLRFLRASLFISTLSLTKRGHSVHEVMSWIKATTEFVVHNLMQLFDLDASNPQTRIGFVHLMQFHRSYPNILSFLTVGEKLHNRSEHNEKQAAAVAASTQLGSRTVPVRSQRKPPVSRPAKHRGPIPANRQPLSPLHESPQEVDSEDEQGDDEGVDGSEVEASEVDSPLFSFANSHKPSSVIRGISESSRSSSEEGLSTPANSRNVSGVTPLSRESSLGAEVGGLKAPPNSRSVSSNTDGTSLSRSSSGNSNVSGLRAPPNSRQVSEAINQAPISRSSSGSSANAYSVPPNSRASTGISPVVPTFHQAELVHPVTGDRLQLDPSHIQMLRDAFNCFKHLNVSELLLHLQAYESNAELDLQGFEQAVRDATADRPWNVQAWNHLRAIFDLFDVESQGTADVIELSVGLSALCGNSNSEDRWRFAFHLMDSASAGYITVREMHDLFTSVLRPLLPEKSYATTSKLESILLAFIPPLFAKAREEDISASDAQSSDEAPSDAERDSVTGGIRRRRPARGDPVISFSELILTVKEYQSKVDFLGVVFRLFQGGKLFGAEVSAPLSQSSSSGSESASRAPANRKKWDKSPSAPVIPKTSFGSSDDEEVDEDSSLASPFSPSSLNQSMDSGSDLDQYIDPDEKAQFQATHHFPTYDEYAATKNAKVQALEEWQRKEEQTRYSRARQAVLKAARIATSSSSEEESDVSEPASPSQDPLNMSGVLDADEITPLSPAEEHAFFTRSPMTEYDRAQFDPRTVTAWEQDQKRYSASASSSAYTSQAPSAANSTPASPQAKGRAQPTRATASSSSSTPAVPTLSVKDQKNPAVQLGLFRYFKQQQVALRTMYNIQSPRENAQQVLEKAAAEGSEIAKQATQQLNQQHAPAAKSRPIPPPLSTPAKQRTGGTNAPPSTPVPALLLPKAKEFEKWVSAVTPRKVNSHRSDDIEEEESDSSDERQNATTTSSSVLLQPVNLSLLPSSSSSAQASFATAGLPSSLVFTVPDQQRLLQLVRLLRSLQPSDPQLSFLNPSAVILKCMEPSIIESTLPSGLGGEPLVRGEDFHEGMKFLFSTAKEAQGFEDVTDDVIEHLLASCFVAYSTQGDAASQQPFGVDDDDYMKIQDFLLALPVWCENKWSSGFRMLSADHPEQLLNRAQLSQFFNSCLRLLFGLHEGLKNSFSPAAFSMLVNRVSEASVDAFFPMADKDGTGWISFTDFQRVKLRYGSKLLPWFGLIQSIQRNAAGTPQGVADEVEDVNSSTNTSFEQSPQRRTKTIKSNGQAADLNASELDYAPASPSDSEASLQGSNDYEDEVLNSSDDELDASASEQSLSPMNSDSEGSEVQSDDEDNGAVPILSVDLAPSLHASNAPADKATMLHLMESDLYHFFFLRSLAVSLDPVTLTQTVLLVEQQAISEAMNVTQMSLTDDEESIGLNQSQYRHIMDLLFPVRLLPRAYHRLLSSLMNQLFLLFSVRADDGKLKVPARELVVALHLLLPSTNDLNLKHAFEFFSAINNSTGLNSGCLNHRQTQQFVGCVLKLLMALTAGSFRFSHAYDRLSLRSAIPSLIRSVSSQAVHQLFHRAQLQTIPAADGSNSEESGISYEEFTRVYAAHPTVLPWVEILDGLVEGEQLSRPSQLNDSLDSSFETNNQSIKVDSDEGYDSAVSDDRREYEADLARRHRSPKAVEQFKGNGSDIEMGTDDEEEAERLFEADERRRRAKAAGYVELSDGESSPWASSPSSPELSPIEATLLREAIVRENQRRNKQQNTDDDDPRRAFLQHWKQVTTPPKQQQSQRSSTTAASAAAAASKPLFQGKQVGSVSSRRSSTSSTGSSGSDRKRRTRKSRVGPTTLSVDPFSVTMHPAQNPSPRAVLSAVKNKPLPIFRVDSTAPKLLLCIPLTQEDPTAQKGGMPAGLFSPGAPSVQSLKVYDTDLPAFTFFKQKLKRVTEEELLSHILSSASASAYGSRRSATANGAIEAQRLLFQTRLSRVEFAQTLRELLQEGPVSNNNIPEAWSNSSQDDALSSPPPNAANVGGGGMQQLQTYTVNLFRMFDHEGRGSVLVVEVLLALSLFLNLTPEDKLRFAFSVLDVSNSGELSPLQLQPLYRAIYSMLSGLCSTHFRMSVPSHPGSPAANTQPTGSNGPLSPSSLHSLPHEQLQKRLESTSQFQSGELFRLANPSRNGKLSLAQFIEVTQRHKHLFSFMHALDLDKVFSPRHADSASEIKHSQSKFEQDLAEASNTKRPFTAPSVNASQGSKSQPMGSPTSSTVDFASAFDSAKTSTRPTTATASKSSGGSAVVPELLFTIPLAVEGSSTPSVQLRFTTASLQTLVILYSKAGFNKLSVKDFHNIFSSRCSNPAHMLTLKQYREILSTTCFAPSELTRLSPGEVQFLRVALDSIFLTISASPDVDRPVDFESLAIALGSISGVEIKQRKIEVAFKILTGTLNDNAAAQLKTMSRTELFRAIRAVLAVLLTLTSPALSYERAKEQRSVIEHSHCEVNGKLASHNAFLKVDHCFNIIHGADAFDRTGMTFPAFESLLQQGELVQADEDNQRTPMEAIGLVPYFSLWDLIDTL